MLRDFETTIREVRIDLWGIDKWLHKKDTKDFR